MEQLNMIPSAKQEDNEFAAETGFFGKPEAPLLTKVRQKFAFYGIISLVFGIGFTILFYKAWFGVNVFLFSLLTVALLCTITNRLSIELKIGTKLYYTGVLLLGISSSLTASDVLQFVNIIGILFLLDLSLLHQFYKDSHWDFAKHTGKMFGLIFYSIAAIVFPFIDGINFLKTTKYLKNDILRNIIIGAIVSIPMLLIITALLSNADMIFGNMTHEVFRVIFSTDIFYILIMIIFGFFACYCILCGTLIKTGDIEKTARKKADPTIAATFMMLLSLVYILFCVIQLAYLFTNGLFALPREFTFAEYARKGYFELLAVTIINIMIMLVCNSFFRDSKVLRFMISLITGCTYIMIASATYRMFLYIGAYHLTFLRVFVLLTLLIDAVVLAGIIVFQYKKDFPLFRYCVVVVSVCYIAFSFSKPDSYIASYLINGNKVLTMDDMQYLTQDLSLDAAPKVLLAINTSGIWDKKESVTNGAYGAYEGLSFQQLFDDYYIRIHNAKKHIGIRDFNYSLFQATQYANKYPK